MSHKVITSKISRNNKVLGWKVYIDGKKYPGKPLNFYPGGTETKAIQLAYREAGLPHGSDIA